MAEFWQDVSPVHLVGRCQGRIPPWLIMSGTADKIAPCKQVLSFQQEVEQHGGQCDVQLFSGVGHSFYRRGNPYYFEATMATMLTFLEHVDHFDNKELHDE